jgi:hypothetical protein
MDIKSFVIHNIKKYKSKIDTLTPVLSRQKTYSFLALAFLLIAIPLTVVQSLHIQDNRQHADDGTGSSACVSPATCESRKATKEGECTSILANDNCATGLPPEGKRTKSQQDLIDSCETATSSRYTKCVNESASLYTICRANICPASPLSCEDQCYKDYSSDKAAEACKKAKCQQAPVPQPFVTPATPENNCIKTTIIGENEKTVECVDECRIQVKTETGYYNCKGIRVSGGITNPYEGNTVCEKANDTNYCESEDSCQTGYTRSKDSCVDNGHSFGFCCVKKVSTPGGETTPGAPSSGGSTKPGGGSTIDGDNKTISIGSEVSINGADGFANLRKLPGINQEIIDSIANSTKANVIGGPKKATNSEDSYNWLNITLQDGKLKGTSGWIADIVLNASTGTSPAPVSQGGTDNPCTEAGFYKVGGKPCSTPTPLPKGTTAQSPGTKPSTGGTTPGVTSPVTTQLVCGDNPILPAVNKTWKAYCTNTYKCASNDDCRKALPESAGSTQCYPFTNGSYCIQEQSNTLPGNSAGLCRDNPEPPPSSSQVWKAACGGKVCTKHSDCPQNPEYTKNATAKNADRSNWCYGFDDGARCLMLQEKESSPKNVTPNPSIPANLASRTSNTLSSPWERFREWVSGLFK